MFVVNGPNRLIHGRQFPYLPINNPRHTYLPRCPNGLSTIIGQLLLDSCVTGTMFPIILYLFVTQPIHIAK